MDIKERVAYLSGLMDGLELEEASKESKIFTAILDVLQEIAGEMEDMQDDLEELEEFVEALDEDLDDVEEYLESDDEDDDEDNALIDIECPSCGYMNSFNPEIIWAADGEVNVRCSNCNTVIFSTSDDEDEDFDDDDEDDDDDFDEDDDDFDDED